MSLPGYTVSEATAVRPVPKLDLFRLDEHEAAKIFPMMSDGNIRKLADDIRINGLRHWITLAIQNGKHVVLDGRNRLLACAMAGEEPRWSMWEGKDPAAFVLSENLHRRHLSESQRGMVAARMANLREGRPKTESIDSVSLAVAAEKLKVSRPTVQRARKVLESACEPLIKAVDDGLVSVNEGAQIAALPVERIPEEVERVTSPSPSSEPGRRRRVDLMKRTEDVSRLHEEGLGTAEISRKLGIDKATVSSVKVALGVAETSAGVRLWRDVEHITATLEGASHHIAKVTSELLSVSPSASQEEIRQCTKRLSRVTVSMRALSLALKSRST
jgi:hypothetical protein